MLTLISSHTGRNHKGTKYSCQRFQFADKRLADNLAN